MEPEVLDRDEALKRIREGRPLEGAQLKDFDWREMDLRGATFRNCLLEKLDFTGADLSNLSATESVFMNCNFAASRMTAGKMPQCVFNA